ncbi:MAG TPA: sensor histidine kinase [Trebonia sp.]
MGSEWRARLARAAAGPAGVRAGVALLALAGVGQAIGQAADQGGGRTAGELATRYGLPLCVLALASTLPLLLSPLPSAAVIAAANVLAFVSFSGPTAAGMIALLVAAARLGAAGEPAGRAALAPFPASSPASLPAWLPASLPALGLGLPFLVIAQAGHAGAAAVLLAALAPVAAGSGLVARSTRQAKTYSAAGEALAGTLVAHTARGERARIARELHDVVAHHLSMIAVLAETGRLATPGLPEAGARRFAEIGDTARGGLTEMRRLLGVLREDAADAGPPGTEVAGAGPPPSAGAASRHPQPGLTQLAELVDAAREASGATARLIISGPVTPIDPGVELAAYRIVQEALTNARRHAAGAAIDVELRYAPDVLRLRVRDNGPGPVPSSAVPSSAGPPGIGPPGAGPDPGGHGLLGMRERAFSVGGSLYTGAAPGGGFLVEAVLPAARDTDGARTVTTGASGASGASRTSGASGASGAMGRG